MINIIILNLGTDVVYFLWFITLQFTFPEHIISPMKSALFGSMHDLRAMVYQLFRKKPTDSSSIN